MRCMLQRRKIWLTKNLLYQLNYYRTVIKLGNTYFTADTHFGHNNIIEYCSRPFKDVDEMNKTLIDNINSVCSTRDTLLHLGDFCFVGSITNSAGNSIHQPDYYFSLIDPQVIIIRGNHDSRATTGGSIIQDMTIKTGGQYIYCSHEPYPKLNINFSGHVHGMYKVVKMGHKYVVNVGVDVWDYSPIDINQALEAIQEHRHYFSGKAKKFPIQVRV